MKRTTSFLVVLAGLGFCACEDSRSRTPTAPTLDQVIPAALHWRGTITLEDATPQSSCLVTGFYAIGGDRERSARADSSALILSRTWLRLGVSLEEEDLGDNWWVVADPYDGFFPAESYEGRRDASGVLRFRSTSSSTDFTRASVSSSVLCTSTWQRLGSELTGTLSADGARFQGEIVTRYRELNVGDAEFTVRARFDLEQKSYEDSF